MKRDHTTISRPRDNALLSYGYTDPLERYRLEDTINRVEYLHTGMGFDVNPGDSWLDLGAGTGSFAAYTWVRDASVVCYERCKHMHNLLKDNTENMEGVRSIYHEVVTHSLATRLFTSWYDGVKIDLAGGEHLLLDHEVLPECNKCVIRYYYDTPQFPEVQTATHLDILRDHFEIVEVVSVPATLYRPVKTQLLFCMN